AAGHRLWLARRATVRALPVRSPHDRAREAARGHLHPLAMIELHQFPPMLGVMNPSPFCMKVEVFLRLAGLEYAVVTAAPLGQPKGKLPVVRDEGLVVPDSEAIVAHLQRVHGARMPSALAAPDTPRQLLLRR